MKSFIFGFVDHAALLMSIAEQKANVADRDSAALRGGMAPLRPAGSGARGGAENAGVENAGVESRGRKCSRPRVAYVTFSCALASHVQIWMHSLFY